MATNTNDKTPPAKKPAMKPAAKPVAKPTAKPAAKKPAAPRTKKVVVEEAVVTEIIPEAPKEETITQQLNKIDSRWVLATVIVVFIFIVGILIGIKMVGDDATSSDGVGLSQQQAEMLQGAYEQGLYDGYEQGYNDGLAASGQVYYQNDQVSPMGGNGMMIQGQVQQ